LGKAGNRGKGGPQKKTKKGPTISPKGGRTRPKTEAPLGNRKEGNKKVKWCKK